MKPARKLIVLLSLGALLPFAAFAKTPEQAYLETVTKAPGVPVPVTVVSPRDVSPNYAGATVELEFTVDSRGTPNGFTVVSSPDPRIAGVMVDAVRQWRFTPASKNGTPVAIKVLLPLRVSVAGDRFAAN